MNDTNVKINQYAAAFIVSLCAIYTASIPLSGMTFFLETSAICLVGTAISYIWRVKNWSFATLEAPVIICLTLLSIFAVVSAGFPSIITALSFQGDRSIALAQLLAWMIAIRSYSLSSDTSLLFSCIPPLAMFGLTATIVPDFHIMPIFVIFIFFAIFLIIGDLGTVGTGVMRHGIKSKPAFLQSVIAGACITPALVGGMILSPPLQSLTMAYIRISGLVSKAHRANQSLHPHFIRFNDNKEFQVGTGPVSQSNTVVMSVQAPKAYYMRGNSYDYYTGSGWKDTLPIYIPLKGANSWNKEFGDYTVVPTTISRSFTKSPQVRQTVQVFNSSISEIYAASEIRRLIMVPQMAFTNGAGTIKLDVNLFNMNYTVFSSIPTTNKDMLRLAGDKYPSIIKSLYLQLPYDKKSSTYRRLKALCDQIIKGLTNNYDRIEALKNWIANNCYYSTKAAATPPNTDAAGYFLLDYHIGYCDRFATSLAVLCRIAGIPARVATGFAPGEDTGGEYIIREKDSHAWTEVYFPNDGWITMDATDNARDIQLKPESSSILASLQAFFSGNQKYSALFIALAIIAIAFVAYRETHRRRLPSVTLQSGEIVPENNQKIVAFYILATRTLGKKGFARPIEMTPTEYLNITNRSIPMDNAVILGLYELTRLCNLARYSSKEMNTENVNAAERAYKQIKMNLKTITHEMQSFPVEGSRI